MIESSGELKVRRKALEQCRFSDRQTSVLFRMNEPAARGVAGGSCNSDCWPIPIEATVYILKSGFSLTFLERN
jgi:hypothetical protein